MAEVLLRKTARRLQIDEMEALSAGLYAREGTAASFGAISAMQRRGIDLYHHYSQGLTRELAHGADLILCMEESHARAVKAMLGDSAKGKVYGLLGFATGREEDIADPFGGDEREYDQTARQIELALAAALMKLYPEKAGEIQASYEAEL
jgi:protein-tyrosine phosphatase